jgi:hypothetical protein
MNAPSAAPVPKIAAAAKTGGTLSLAAIVALILGADINDPLVQGIAAIVLAAAPVVAGYLKRDA